MANHQNRAASLPNIVVTNANGERFDNLRGVFRRAFPIVCGQVRNGKEPQRVTYYGETYTVARDASQPA
jgi:hypothetical protein